MGEIKEEEILQHVRNGGLIPSDKSQLHVYLRVARRNRCTEFIEKLARSIDNGDVFFSRARSRLTSVDRNEGKYFCCFLNEVHSKRGGDTTRAECTLQTAASTLLLFVAGRAIRSSWFRNLSYDALKNTITLRPLPFGTEYDLALLTFSWIEWNRPFDQNPEKIVTLISNLFSVRVDDEYLSNIAKELAKRSLDRPSTLVRLAKHILRCSTELTQTTTEDHEDAINAINFLSSTIDRELLTVLLSKCWKLLMATKSNRVPDRGSLASSRLYLQHNMLFEYNHYVDAYRLIALPPVGVLPSDSFFIVARGPNSLLSVHPSSKNVYRLDLSTVVAPMKNLLRTDAYPGHVWKLVDSRMSEVETNVFTEGEQAVKITTNPTRPSEWSVKWYRGTVIGRDLDFIVPSPIPQYCSQIVAILKDFRLIVVGARHLDGSFIPPDVEYVLDLITRHVEKRKVDSRGKGSSNVPLNLDTASCRSAWSAGLPVVIGNLSNHPPPLCVGEAIVPSCREGFWVPDDSERTQLENLEWLNWRTDGRFTSVNTQRLPPSGIDVDPDGVTLAALFTMRASSSSSSSDDVSSLTNQIETMEVCS